MLKMCDKTTEMSVFVRAPLITDEPELVWNECTFGFEWLRFDTVMTLAPVLNGAESRQQLTD